MGQFGEISEGVVGQHSDLIVAQVPEKKRKGTKFQIFLSHHLVEEETRVFYLQSCENPQVVQPLWLDRLDVVHVQIQFGGFRRNPTWNLRKLRSRTSHHRAGAITLGWTVIVSQATHAVVCGS